MKPTLVTSYVNPDLDGVSCMVAYAELLRATGTDAEAGIIGEPHVEAVYVLDRFDIRHPSRIPDAQDYERVVLVDASDPVDLEGAIPPERVTEVIDHRAVHGASAFTNARAQIEPVGAAATLVAERFRQQGIAPSRESATLLCGGIISNTRNLKASVTTDRDRETLGWLNAIAQLPENFWRDLFISKSDVSGGKLAHRMRGDLKHLELGGKRIGIAEVEMMGARAVVSDRHTEIAEELRSIGREQQLDFIFLIMVDLETMETSLVADDESTRDLLAQALEARFSGSVATLSRLMMRKQIIPLLKTVLEY